MVGEKAHIEHESSSRDVSLEFTNMNTFDFFDFLHTLRREPMLSIKVDWSGTDNAKRLKAFLEDSPTKQRRTATIRCSEAQFNQAPNVFASGVKWEKVDEK